MCVEDGSLLPVGWWHRVGNLLQILHTVHGLGSAVLSAYSGGDGVLLRQAPERGTWVSQRSLDIGADPCWTVLHFRGRHVRIESAVCLPQLDHHRELYEEDKDMVPRGLHAAEGGGPISEVGQNGSQTHHLPTSAGGALSDPARSWRDFVK